ncbi:MAG: ThuA domain-containing protein [Lentisphaeria bacterium]|nr:ThuA domain-containing protein [Lentisphaeria bacterium]
MIYFFADNHYDSHPGKNIFDHLSDDLKNRINFFEDDWSELENSNWESDCELLILNLIGDTCNIPHPDSNAEKRVKKYLQSGGNALLLHGSSAAFWQWQWWREIVGLRWVRPNDPDQIAASTHPIKPCKLRVCKVRHPLAEKLIPLELPTDEIYTELEQVSPITVLLDTFIEEGVYPQCLENFTPWGGKFIHFIPGHAKEVTENQKFISNITAIINYLTGAEK